MKIILKHNFGHRSRIKFFPLFFRLFVSNHFIENLSRSKAHNFLELYSLQIYVFIAVTLSDLAHTIALYLNGSYTYWALLTTMCILFKLYTFLYKLDALLNKIEVFEINLKSFPITNKKSIFNTKLEAFQIS